MHFTELKPSTIFTIENFFAAEECDSHIAWSEKRGYKKAKINWMGRQVVMTDIRNNSRVMFADNSSSVVGW